MVEWHAPEEYVAEIAQRPAPIRRDDPGWKYVNVRRLPAYIEASIAHGLQWAVFEPNSERLWTAVDDDRDPSGR